MAGREQLFSGQSLLPAPEAGLGWQFYYQITLRRRRNPAFKSLVSRSPQEKLVREAADENRKAGIVSSTRGGNFSSARSRMGFPPVSSPK